MRESSLKSEFKAKCFFKSLDQKNTVYEAYIAYIFKKYHMSKTADNLHSWINCSEADKPAELEIGKLCTIHL